MGIVEMMRKDMETIEKYSTIYNLIIQQTGQNDYFETVYETFYKNHDPESVYFHTKRKKHRRKVIEWHHKVIEGYQLFLQRQEMKRGIYGHLVEHHLYIKKTEKEMGPVLFKQMFSVSDSQEEITKRIEDLLSCCKQHFNEMTSVGQSLISEFQKLRWSDQAIGLFRKIFRHYAIYFQKGYASSI